MGLRERLEGKEIYLGLTLFIVAWGILFVCISPVAYYKSTKEVPCSDSADSLVTTFSVTLWRYHSCDRDPFACELQCINKPWSELWKVGCGGIGPRGQEVYCWDFDVAGEMTAIFLILGLCFSFFVLPLTVIRLWNIRIRFATPTRIAKVQLTLLSFCWSCCIMSWIWYPYITDADLWEQQTGGTIHLALGWYLLLSELPLFFIVIVFYILDYVRLSHAHAYESQMSPELRTSYDSVG